MTCRALTLILAGLILMCGRAAADSVDKELDRALIGGPLTLDGRHTTSTGDLEIEASGLLWLESLPLRNPDRGAAEASGIIDTLMVDFANHSLGVSAVRNAWFKEATHCTQFLIDQGKSEEAVSFVKRERARAQKYSGDPDLGPTAAMIRGYLCILLHHANLPGCD